MFRNLESGLQLPSIGILAYLITNFYFLKITYNKVQWMSRSIMCQLWDEKREFLQSSGICQLIDATNQIHVTHRITPMENAISSFSLRQHQLIKKLASTRINLDMFLGLKICIRMHKNSKWDFSHFFPDRHNM